MSPIILFVYNRPRHTRQVVEALLKNEEAGESDLYVYSDGPACAAEGDKVGEVRSYIRKINGFHRITIIERDMNMGLADSIIDGLTRVTNAHGRVIALEDDVVTSPYFLRYMNTALDRYEHENRIWHISGWSYPIDPAGLPDAFLWRVMNCWGWATWRDRWRYFRRDPAGLITRFTQEQINRFNLDGSHDFWAQVRANVEGDIKTWAIFWYAVIFMNGGLCLNPTRSLVNNIGHDGSGIHCGRVKASAPGKFSAQQPVRDFPDMIEENREVVDRIKQMLKEKKSGKYIKRWLCGLNMGKSV